MFRKALDGSRDVGSNHRIGVPFRPPPRNPSRAEGIAIRRLLPRRRPAATSNIAPPPRRSDRPYRAFFRDKPSSPQTLIRCMIGARSSPPGIVSFPGTVPEPGISGKVAPVVENETERRSRSRRPGRLRWTGLAMDRAWRVGPPDREAGSGCRFGYHPAIHREPSGKADVVDQGFLPEGEDPSRLSDFGGTTYDDRVEPNEANWRGRSRCPRCIECRCSTSWC